ncbi:MAG TPA: hypothetical protein VIL37_09395 [Natronosporangium sp.]
MRISRRRSSDPDRDRLIAALARLPSASDRDFPQAVRSALEAFTDPEPILRRLVTDHSLPRAPRFAALYALLLRLRREERYAEYSEFVRRFEGEFGTEPYFLTFRAILLRARGDLASLRSAVELSRQAVNLMPQVAGIVHQLAAFWIEYLERLDAPVPGRDLDEVERHVDKAIALSHGGVAHYLETKSRVLMMRGEFDAARAAIGQAIESEPRSSRDYQRRLTQYQTTRVRIELMEERARWQRSHQQFHAELAEFKGQQLQLLGLLAAIVAFIVTAGNIASQTSGVDGIRLIMAAAGAIAVVFGTFSLLTSNNLRRVLLTVAIGCTLIGVGILLPTLGVE